jgi:hypothetical protein
MKRILMVCLAAMVFLTACSGAGSGQQVSDADIDEVITIYKSPT